MSTLMLLTYFTSVSEFLFSDEILPSVVKSAGLFGVVDNMRVTRVSLWFFAYTLELLGRISVDGPTRFFGSPVWHAL